MSYPATPPAVSRGKRGVHAAAAAAADTPEQVPGKLIAVIADEDTVTGLLIAGIGALVGGAAGGNGRSGLPSLFVIVVVVVFCSGRRSTVSIMASVAVSGSV